MSRARFRKAARSDMDWLYATFKRTMQDFIEKTWGWNELFQQHGFLENLPPGSFVILRDSGEDVGACSIVEKSDHLWLEMVLVVPEHQGRGLGGELVRHAQGFATQKRKPLRLSVLRINPAQHFYTHQGFTHYADDDWSLKLQWAPPQ